MVLATWSLPTPHSPRISTVASVSATSSMIRAIARIWELSLRSKVLLTHSSNESNRSSIEGSRATAISKGLAGDHQSGKSLHCRVERPVMAARLESGARGHTNGGQRQRHADEGDRGTGGGHPGGPRRAG